MSKRRACRGKVRKCFLSQEYCEGRIEKMSVNIAKQVTAGVRALKFGFAINLMNLQMTTVNAAVYHCCQLHF